MGRIGVLFLFYLGLESSVTRFDPGGTIYPRGRLAVYRINFTVGLSYGYLTGFPLRETLIVAGLTTVSSAIVAKILFRLPAHRQS